MSDTECEEAMAETKGKLKEIFESVKSKSLNKGLDKRGANEPGGTRRKNYDSDNKSSSGSESDRKSNKSGSESENSDSETEKKNRKKNKNYRKNKNQGSGYDSQEESFKYEKCREELEGCKDQLYTQEKVQQEKPVDYTKGNKFEKVARRGFGGDNCRYCKQLTECDDGCCCEDNEGYRADSDSDNECSDSEQERPVRKGKSSKSNKGKTSKSSKSNKGKIVQSDPDSEVDSETERKAVSKAFDALNPKASKAAEVVAPKASAAAALDRAQNFATVSDKATPAVIIVPTSISTPPPAVIVVPTSTSTSMSMSTSTTMAKVVAPKKAVATKKASGPVTTETITKKPATSTTTIPTTTDTVKKPAATKKA